jgi:serine/threonine-protein kinase
MGVVYKAEDTKLKRTVALKFLPPVFSFNQEAKKRFINEAQAASSLQHNNICNIHDIDETKDGQIFICMDCYEGETLKKKIEQGQIKTDEAIDIVVQVATGLQKAHEKGIIHRDIKPANIFITNDGVVKILDFGLAKLSGQTMMTKMGETVGTIAYMSPEQTRGELVDSRTDIWSLGVLLYEMITGELPFKSEYEQALIYSILNEEPKPVTSLRIDIPMKFAYIIKKALQKDLQKRFQGIGEFLSDLNAVKKNGESEAKEVLPSIAVLPFVNMSPDPEDEYFSDGITDDIIAQLSKISELKVISRTSVMQYKGISKNIRQIGQELDVGTVLEGSVRHAGNQVRIVAQLIDARNEGHIWADTYDKEMTQIFAVQSDVAQNIAVALKAKLSSGEKERIEKKQTENTEAYQLYLKGRFYWNKRQVDDMRTAIEYFKKAIERDPDYALAYAGLASSYIVLSQHGIPQEECYAKAQSAATRALGIDSTLAEAYATLGVIVTFHDYDWKGAEKLFIRALEFEPGNPSVHQWYSLTLSFIGRSDEALSEIKRAQELDPLSLIINVNLGRVLYTMGQYDSAIEQYKNTLALDQNFPWAHLFLASVYAVQRRFDKALTEYEKVRSLVGSSPLALTYLGCMYARTGRRNDGLQVLEELLQMAQQGNAVSSGIAFLYYELGEKEKAFEWLEKVHQCRESYLLFLVTDPLWDDLRTDPRCIALLKKMGLEK